MSVLTAYQRFRFLWGAVDWQAGGNTPYSPSQTGANLGSSAAAGAGVGVRRAVLKFDRGLVRTGLDPAEMHFDFLNLTSGSPDDTWTTTDYEDCEDSLLTYFWGNVKSVVSTQLVLDRIDWYRHGPGVTAPNPVERTLDVNVPGTSSSQILPPQVACSLTLRTGVRKSWGRTYLPGLTSAVLDSHGALATTSVDGIEAALRTMVAHAVGQDFPVVVVSNHLSAALNVEATEVDDVPDIIRRRRFPAAVYKKIETTA